PAPLARVSSRLGATARCDCPRVTCEHDLKTIRDRRLIPASTPLGGACAPPRLAARGRGGGRDDSMLTPRADSRQRGARPPGPLATHGESIGGRGRSRYLSREGVLLQSQRARPLGGSASSATCGTGG